MGSSRSCTTLRAVLHGQGRREQAPQEGRRRPATHSGGRLAGGVSCDGVAPAGRGRRFLAGTSGSQESGRRSDKAGAGCQNAPPRPFIARSGPRGGGPAIHPHPVMRRKQTEPLLQPVVRRHEVMHRGTKKVTSITGPGTITSIYGDADSPPLLERVQRRWASPSSTRIPRSSGRASHRC